MSFIIFIAVLFIFFYLNSRISTLEQLVRSQYGKNQTVSPKTPDPVAAPQVNVAVPAPQPKIAATSEEVGGNWLGKIGVTAVVLGLLFFLQYAFEEGWVTPLGLIAIGALVGLALIGTGSYLRAKHELYSQILIGGGFAVLFVSDFVGSAVYELFNTPVALGISLLITASATLLAIRNSSQALMVLASIGAFLSIFILGMGEDQLVMALSYASVLSIGILVTSVFKKWQVANGLGFAGTYLTYIGLFLAHYAFGVNTAIFAFFLTVFFLVYLINTVLHYFVRNEQSTPGEIVLVWLNALIAFFFYYVLLAAHFEEVTAYISLGYAVIYLLLAYLASVYSASATDLRNTLAGISAFFMTVFIPLQFDGRAVTIGWFILALGMLFITAKYSTAVWRVFAVVAYALALFRFFFVDNSLGELFLNPSFAVGILGVVVSYAGAWISHHWSVLPGDSDKRPIASVFFFLAHFLTLFIISREIYHYYTNAVDYYQERDAIVSVVWTVYAVILLVAGFVGKMKVFRTAGLVIFFVAAMKIFVDIWDLGQVYRIISSVVYGVIALIASFFYSKHKDSIKEIVS